MTPRRTRSAIASLLLVAVAIIVAGCAVAGVPAASPDHERIRGAVGAGPDGGAGRTGDVTAGLGQRRRAGLLGP